MKKLLTLFAVLAMFAMAGCESLGDGDVVGGSYSINGAIQKGPFIQGSSITIQPLNKHLKPNGQMYTTQTTNDAGMFEMDGVNSKYAEIIATGYYFDEVEGKISASPLTLRSIADLKDGTQTNVNLLTSLTYNRIKNLVTNEGKGISEAQEQAEKELYTALGIPAELQPNVSCGAMNIANNGEGDGLLLVISAVLQEGRTTGELTEYISKFSTDLADDGMVETALLEKFNLDGQHLVRFEGRIKENLEARYESLGIECNVPEFSQYLSYLGKPSEHFIIPFTYYEDKKEALPNNPEEAINLKGIEEGFVFNSDVEYLGYAYNKGYGEIYLSATPTVINRCYCEILRTIDIPNSVTMIGEGAFMDDKCLEELCIPNSVVEIGKKAFFNCWNIKSIIVPQGVTIINEGTFYNCMSLASVTLPNGIATIEGGQMTYDHFGMPLLDGYGAFQGCTSLIEVNIPEGVRYLDAGTFYGCTSLARVTIPDSCFSLGEVTFYGCSSLTSINIPEGVDLINTALFYGCSSLSNISLPDSCYCINEYAFWECTSLTNINIPVGCIDIRQGAFVCCNSLSEVSIPIDCRLNHIGECAFRYCSSLKSITIPNGVAEIAPSTFDLCSSLESVSIPEGVTSIGAHAFQYCTSLTSVTIPNSVISIEPYVFIGCTSLAEFKGKFASDDGRCLIIDGALMHVAPVGLTELSIPKGVTSIGERAFENCTSLTSVTIPNSVTSIGYYAFSGCSSLVSVTIPESVTEIEAGAFVNCRNLTDVYCKSIIPPTAVISFGSWTAFMYIMIHVPMESVEAYKTAEHWSEYADDIVSYDFE